MAKKPRPEESSEDEVFHVGEPPRHPFPDCDPYPYPPEVITKARVNDDKEWEYYVKWAGYDSDADSWEPSENVHSCDRLLRSFWTHVGTDNEDYEPGYLVEAEPSWIAREREFFTKRIKSQTEEKEKERMKHAKPTKMTKRNQTEKLKHFVETINSGGESDESEGTPLSQTQKPAKTRKKRSRVSSVSSDTDNSMPLSKSLPRSASGSSKRKASSILADDASAGPTKSHSPVERPRKATKLKAKDSAPVLKINTSSAPLKGKEKAQTTPTATSTDNPTRFSSPTSLFSADESPKKTATSSVQTDATGKPLNPKRYPPAKVKMIDPKFTDTSALGTKRRLAEREAVPKPIEELSRKAAYSNLKFSKKDPSKTTASPEVASPTDAVSWKTQTASRTQRFSFSKKPSVVEQPADEGPQTNDETYSAPAWEEPAPPEPRTPALSSAASTVADRFLSTIMPAGLAAPIQDGVESPTESSRTASIPKPKLPIGKISKKFRWTGDMFYNTSSDRAERLCAITITEPHELVPNALRISICVNSRDSLRFEKLLPVSTLRVLRPAWAPVTEIAKFGPSADEDKEPFDTLLKYMANKELITLARMTLDDNPVAALVIFPSANQALCEEFNVPESLRAAGNLVAALLPWVLSAAKIRKLDVSPLEPPEIPGERSALAQPTDLARRVRFNPGYMRALYTLQFPAWLHDYMSRSSRTFFVWSTLPGTRRDGQPVTERVETKALSQVLTQCGAREVEADKPARLVFVHVGALRTLHKLVGLVERCQKPSIQFFTYGTNETIPPERWGVREIFPLGGIATFTWTAYMENPVALDQFISMVEDHPLWSCYVTPSAMAMLVREGCGSDPLSAFQSGNFPFETLFSMIERGRVALLSPPPLGRSSERATVDWVSTQTKVCRFSGQEILQYCLKHFMERYIEMPEERWPALVFDEIAATSSSLRQQPSMMDSYRRFVIIRGNKSKETFVSSSKIGSECVPLAKFEFSDGFYTNDDMNDLKSTLPKGAR
ncbi:hypothetical protein EVG20_g5292 [Dentipellis fragilis]|uniref:Chromo domain-containing protein n=1 Tax=Dentipellis fragilis TaxID=205917 RepID=A0A4Y9YTS3_9AGAM|nr:hypothetical protein EVG20_g5292 [Dentipellis fragilis]